jgi:hypothetical protein
MTLGFSTIGIVDLFTLGEIGDINLGVGILGICGIIPTSTDILFMVDILICQAGVFLKAVDSIEPIAEDTEMSEVRFAPLAILLIEDDQIAIM